MMINDLRQQWKIVKKKVTSEHVNMKSINRKVHKVENQKFAKRFQV
jgi:hypothetical protein